MTKQQICGKSTHYVTSYLAFRKADLCALERSSSSGFALAAMPTSCPPPKLMPCCFLTLVKSSITEPSTCHCALRREGAQQNQVMPGRNQSLPVPSRYFSRGEKQPSSKADWCSQLDNSLLLRSGTGMNIWWEGAYTGQLEQQHETKG